MRVGFVGLGNMGGGMAARLAAAGHEVVAFDLSADALERARGAGCAVAGSAAQSAERSDAVITMLPAGVQVAEVWRSSLFGAMREGGLLVDCSTIDVATARALAAEAEARGLDGLDAPVSGGIAAAAGGTLTFMVGGSVEGFARARPLLSAMGKAVIHAGGPGAGQAAKIANNMLLAATMVATAEAFRLAEALGLDPQRFFDIASVSSGQSWSMTSYCPLAGVGPESPADRGYAGGFATRLMMKDLGLALEAARDAGQRVPMGERAGEIYAELMAAGEGDRDFSVVARHLERHAGLKPSDPRP